MPLKDNSIAERFIYRKAKIIFFLNDSQLSWLVYTLELIHSFACNFLWIVIIIIIQFSVMTKFFNYRY